MLGWLVTLLGYSLLYAFLNDLGLCPLCVAMADSFRPTLCFVSWNVASLGHPGKCRILVPSIFFFFPSVGLPVQLLSSWECLSENAHLFPHYHFSRRITWGRTQGSHAVVLFLAVATFQKMARTCFHPFLFHFLKRCLKFPFSHLRKYL